MTVRSTRRGVARLVALLILCQPLGLLAGRFSEAHLLVPKNDDKMQEVQGTLHSDAKARHVRFDTGGRAAFEVAYDRIRSLLYERAAKPRDAAGLLLAWPPLHQVEEALPDDPVRRRLGAGEVRDRAPRQEQLQHGAGDARGRHRGEGGADGGAVKVTVDLVIG